MIINPGDEAWTIELAVEEIETLRARIADQAATIALFQTSNAQLIARVAELEKLLATQHAQTVIVSADLSTARAEVEAEKARRIYYQQIVYDVCNRLDRVLGNSVTEGTGIVCGTKDAPSRETQDSLDWVFSNMEKLRAELQSAKEDSARLEWLAANEGWIQKGVRAKTRRAPFTGDNLAPIYQIEWEGKDGSLISQTSDGGDADFRVAIDNARNALAGQDSKP